MTRWLTAILLTLSLLVSLVGVAAGKGPFLRYEVLADESAKALSALTYEKKGAVYWSITDTRDTSDTWMLYLYKIKINAKSARVVEKIPVRDLSGRHLSGADVHFEGLSLAPDGTFWGADEHGPWILQFAKNGTLLQKIEAPEKFKDRRQGQGV